MNKETQGRASFAWDIHYKCNYRCPYCWWYGKWHELAKGGAYLPLKEILKPWIDIYKKYGSCHIVILGGEPFVYPDFAELIRELSGMHTLGITTNLSVDVDQILNNISLPNISISGTFHPLFADFNSFVKRACLLKEKTGKVAVSYLAYPPQVRLISDYKRRFAEYSITLEVMSYWGEHNGKRYPESYTEEERSFIEPFLGESRGEKFQLRPKDVKGGLCRAGQVYASIKSNGDAVRCGGSGSPRSLGNIFKGNFSLLDRPSPCESDHCPCNEWAFLLTDKDISFAEEIVSKNDAESRLWGKKAFTEEEEKEVGRSNYIIVDIATRQPIIRKSAIDRQKIAPHYVFFTWDIHYACNYRCTYCNTPKPAQPLEMWKERNRKKVAYPGLETWIKVWKDIYERYGSSEIHITGGEPFIYPNFIELIKELSKIHTLEIITNLAFNVYSIINNMTPDRLRLGTTFHPEFTDVHEFLEKHKILRKHGFETWSNYVLYPPLLEMTAKYKSEFDKFGIPFNMQPYLGFYKGKEYPMGYSSEELLLLKDCYREDDIVNKKTIEWKTSAPKRNMRDKPCRMGQMYAKIYPTGDVYRCCANEVSGLGNLIDGTFELIEEALPCESEHCFCWRCMLECEEKNWGQHWVIPKKAVEVKTG